MNDFPSISKVIKKSFLSIQLQISAVEKEALQLIETRCTDTRTIEYYLDTLHSLHISGFKVKAYHRLIAYLETLDKKIAKWHRKEFKKE